MQPCPPQPGARWIQSSPQMVDWVQAYRSSGWGWGQGGLDWRHSAWLCDGTQGAGLCLATTSRALSLHVRGDRSLFSSKVSTFLSHSPFVDPRPWNMDNGPFILQPSEERNQRGQLLAPVGLKWSAASVRVSLGLEPGTRGRGGWGTRVSGWMPCRSRRTQRTLCYLLGNYKTYPAHYEFYSRAYDAIFIIIYVRKRGYGYITLRHN